MGISLNKSLVLSALILAIGACQSCKKPPGPGGRATIKGTVFKKDFDSQYRYQISSGPASGQKVNIIYGSTVVGKNVTTDEKGNFEFRFLNRGHYRVFVNSIDTSYKMKGNKTNIPVIRNVDITNTKQVVTVDPIIINQ